MRLRHFLTFLTVAAALTATSCGDSNHTFPVRTSAMGDQVVLGHVTFRVFETQWLTHLGQGADARIPQNRFFLVRLEATNGGASDAIIRNFTLEDDRGVSYPELSSGEGVPEYIGYLRNVKPADYVRGNALFDVPPKHYKLRITDETGERAALIDIPLSFLSETPDVPDLRPATKDEGKQ
jgi:hypothetical protein